MTITVPFIGPSDGSEEWEFHRGILTFWNFADMISVYGGGAVSVASYNLSSFTDVGSGNSQENVTNPYETLEPNRATISLNNNEAQVASSGGLVMNSASQFANVYTKPTNETAATNYTDANYTSKCIGVLA